MPLRRDGAESDPERDARLHMMGLFILKMDDREDVIKFAMEEYGLDRRTAGNHYRDAMARLQKSVEKDRRKRVNLALRQLNHIGREALKDRDFQAARGCVTDQLKITGDFEPQKVEIKHHLPDEGAILGRLVAEISGGSARIAVDGDGDPEDDT